jgi:hypothetical protein
MNKRGFAAEGRKPPEGGFQINVLRGRRTRGHIDALL